MYEIEMHYQVQYKLAEAFQALEPLHFLYFSSPVFLFPR